MPEVAPPSAPEMLAERRPVEISPGLTAAASGVGTAESVGDIGKGEEEYSNALAQRSIQIAAMNNKVAADGAANDVYNKQSQALMDYQANNKGMAAYDNMDKLYTQLEGIRTTGGQGLSPVGTADYLQNTRFSQSRLANVARGYAVEQRNQYITKTYGETMDRLKSQAALSSYGTPEFSAAMSAIDKEVDMQADPSMQGWSAEDADNEKRKAYGAVGLSMVKQAVASGDFQGAKSIVGDFTKKGVDYVSADSMMGLLRQGLQADRVNSFETGLGNGDRIPDPPTPFSAQLGGGSYLAGVHGREGSGQNPYSSAFGTDQFMGGPGGAENLRRLLPTETAGMSDGQVLALRNNPDLMDKATLAYGAENVPKLQAAGFPTTNANVGLAHGFGPGGAEAILGASPSALASDVLPANVVSANKLQGKTVGQIEGDFQRRFGTGQFSAEGATGGPTEAPARFTEQPPLFAPGQDPVGWKAQYEAWGDRLTTAYSAGNPTDKARMMAQVREVATRQAQTYTAQRVDAFNQLTTAAVNDPTVTDLSQLPNDQLQWLTSHERISLESTINQARAGTGEFYSTSERNAATDALGQSITDSVGFAKDPERWLQDKDLSFTDRNKMANLAVRLGDKNSRESERAASWQTYYGSSPLVRNVYSFIGAQTRDQIGNAGGIGKFNSPQELQSRFAQAFMYEVEHGNYPHDPDGKLKQGEAESIVRHLMVVTNTPDNPKRFPAYRVITEAGGPAGSDAGVFPKQVITQASNAPS